MAGSAAPALSKSAGEPSPDQCLALTPVNTGGVGSGWSFEEGHNVGCVWGLSGLWPLPGSRGLQGSPETQPGPLQPSLAKPHCSSRVHGLNVWCRGLRGPRVSCMYARAHVHARFGTSPKQPWRLLVARSKMRLLATVPASVPGTGLQKG